ncbi:MAG: NTP transferase domain-containing protein [Candidatus Scalindua sp.]|nr:NTP transferase domain-containing protein [Candidatus Scalindua sp.]
MSESILNSDNTLMDAVQLIENSVKRLAIVLSEDKHVVGTLTDGDIRRCLLRGCTLDTLATEAMNYSPVIASVNASDNSLRKLLDKNNIRSLPLVDANDCYVRTFHEMEFFSDTSEAQTEKTFSAAIIMAGGEGTRLRPFTENLPKPMIEINGIPLLERQVRCLAKMGMTTIYISVNYLSEIIKEHFGDGSNFGVVISYLDEDKKLGTAGALSLLPELEKSQSIIVMNGDILITSDFVNLFHFHKEHDSMITVSAINYHVEIPYGVIDFKGVEVKALLEKPSQTFFCNAGIYALSIDVLKDIPADTFWNMTDLIDKCLLNKNKVTVFPVHEYWSDIGTPADLEKARKEFKGV